jgi:predicted secreted protein
VRENDPGSDVVLATGEEQRVVLRSLAMAGYRWSASVGGPDAGAVTVEVRRGELNTAAKPGVSAPEEVVLRGVHPGSAIVRLEQRRPWERDARAAQVVELRIQVRARCGS